MIEVKNQEVLKALTTVPLDPGLLWLANVIEAKYGVVCITCAARPNDHGVHGTNPCRGLDIRSSVYQSAEDVTDWINRNGVYDYKRPLKKVAILHDAGSGMHIHLQIHPNTRLNFPR